MLLPACLPAFKFPSLSSSLLPFLPSFPSSPTFKFPFLPPFQATGEKTCPAGLGYSFAAGTTDGPGVGLFYQGQLEGMPLLDNALEAIFSLPDMTEFRRCHEPKPVLLPTAVMECGKIGNGTLLGDLLPIEFEGILPRQCIMPFKWHPDTVEIQVFRIGSVFLLQTPGEFTTMAGRRLREHVRASLIDAGLGEDTQVLIASDANGYTQYITTPEEYMIQRYEGGSTIYGINTLAAYIQEYSKLAVAIVRGDDVASSAPAEDLRDDAVQVASHFLVLPHPAPNHGTIL
jgi:neutral ceramidase